MILSEIRLRIQELGIRPSRQLGQNFLFDQNIAQRIVELASIQPNDPVLEIGPGLGSLTEEILERKPNLTLIEKDSRLAAYLKSRFPQTNLIEGDAFEELSPPLFRPHSWEWLSQSLVLGNLPYSIASPLIVRLCEIELRPKQMVFTIQQEVAERMASPAGNRSFGLLTLLTQTFYEIKIARKVSPGVFWPKPEVQSAVITMKRREIQPFEEKDDELCFRNMAKQAFQKRRKMLGAIFGKEISDTIDPKRRPEDLSISEWIDFAINKRSRSIESK